MGNQPENQLQIKPQAMYFFENTSNQKSACLEFITVTAQKVWCLASILCIQTPKYEKSGRIHLLTLRLYIEYLKNRKITDSSIIVFTISSYTGIDDIFIETSSKIPYFANI